MTPKLEFITAFLDTLAFFFVTPALLGESRLARWIARGGKFTIWVRTVWFNRELGQLSPGSIAPAIMAGLILIAILGFKTSIPGNFIGVMWFTASLGPALFVIFFLLLSYLISRIGLIRALAVCGAALFLVARALVLVSSWHRMV